MILQQACFLCPCRLDSFRQRKTVRVSVRVRNRRRRLPPACVLSSSRSNASVGRSAKDFVAKRLSDELGEEELTTLTTSTLKFSSFGEDPLVDKLRTQLGVIHPIPSPPINRNVAGLFVFFFFVGVVFDKLWTSRKKNKPGRDARPGMLPTSFSLLLENDLQRKESVEWVNMVLGKLWKVYPGGIENWLIGLLQPVIDNLKKPDYVQRVEIKQFSLGEEPLSVRNVERRTSRRVNDLHSSFIRRGKAPSSPSNACKSTMTFIMENSQTFSSFTKQFSQQDLITITSEFSILLGAGAYGKVYKGRFPDGTEVAVKVLNGENNVVEETFTAEAKTMFTASHKNLVKLYGFCFDDSMKALVYELMAGSLDTILYEKEPKIEWAKLYDITIGIAEGLSYLHHGCHEQIIHCDVKPANVLLDLKYSLKLTDFGLAKHMNRDLSHFTLTGLRGTPWFVAPEMVMPLSPIKYTCDVYSYGQMLFEVLARKRNSENQTEDKTFPEQVWDKYVEGHLEEIITECGIKRGDTEKARILSKVGFWCIQFTPEVRPTMRTVVNWLEKVIPVPDPSDPFFAAGSTLSLPSSQDERMLVKWWLLLAKLVAIMSSKAQPKKLPSLELYMQKLFKGPPKIVYQQLRMNKQIFFKLCELFDQKKWLQNTENFSIQEKIAIFLMKTNPRFSFQFQCSNQKLNECFHEVLHAMLMFSKEMIVPPNYDALVGNHCRSLLEGPFKGAVGALDGIVIYSVLRPRLKNSNNCQNVLGVCDFDMKFVYVNAGLLGVDDSRMLDEALRQGDDIFPLPPPGKYYLYDSLCTHTDGFVSPYRNTRYRLQDFRNGGDIINKEEAFNHAHAQLRNIIERAFGVMKARFSILDDAFPPFSTIPPFNNIRTRKNLVVACMAIHNFIRRVSLKDYLFQTWERDGFLLTNKNQHFDPLELNELPGDELVDMVDLRKIITDQLTKDTSYSYKV